MHCIRSVAPPHNPQSLLQASHPPIPPNLLRYDKGTYSPYSTLYSFDIGTQILLLDRSCTLFTK